MKKYAVIALLFAPMLLLAQREQTSVGDNVGVAIVRADAVGSQHQAEHGRFYNFFHRDRSTAAASGNGIHTVNLVTVTARHADGMEFYRHTSHNLKTTGGIDCIASEVANTSTQCAAGNYIALSSTLSSPTAGDCAGGSSTCTLTGEIATNGLSRHQAVYAHTSSTSTYTLAYTWTATGTVAAVTGAAVFNASSSGTSLFENTFSSVALNSGDQITVTWTITIS